MVGPCDDGAHGGVTGEVFTEDAGEGERDREGVMWCDEGDSACRVNGREFWCVQILVSTWVGYG